MNLRSGAVRVAVLAAVLGAGGPSAVVGAVPQSAHHPDYRKCRVCLPALGKALAYLKANLASDKPRRVIGSKLGGYVFGGFAFLLEGQSPQELEECVRYCRQAVRDEGFNRNWYLGLSLAFLAEVATRQGLSPEIGRAISEGLKNAAAQQEETGGWCHHREFWKESGYNTRGGGKDLGMLTAILYAALTEIKALGIPVGSILERAEKNLESLSDGMGVRYGTDNAVGDPAMARASWALLGLQATGQTGHRLYRQYVRGLEQRYKRIEEGVHGFAPLHYFGVAAAMHRQGPETYARFTAEYLDRLIATQTSDGVVPLRGEDDVASTAVFASIVMMQKPGAFVPPRRKNPAAPRGTPPREERSAEGARAQETPPASAAVDISVDASQVPELQAWASRIRSLGQEWYPRIAALLPSDGYVAPRKVSILLEKDKKGIADTSGTRIRIAANWVRQHPEDLGMVIHELTHVVQAYPRGAPGWLTEGIADYIRYFHYEVQPIPPKERRTGTYRDGYRTAASFLAWIARTRDPEVVRKANAALRAGAYADGLFETWTGKSLEALWSDYKNDG